MKKLTFLLLLVLGFEAQSQILISLTKTKHYDQNGSAISVSNASVFICTENISSVEPSGSGAIVMLKTPQKLNTATVTGFSVTSTPDQINTLVNSVAASFALSAGTVGAPSGAWASEPASGWYRIGANDYGFAVNGVKVQEIAAAGNSLSGLTTMTNATAAAATITALSTASISSTGIVKFGGTPQTLTGAGAVNLTAYSTLLVTTANPDALTLADGAEGQFKFIQMKTDGGDGVLTPTNLRSGSTITFNDANDFVLLFFIDGEWSIITNSGATVG